MPRNKVKLCPNCFTIIYRGCSHSQAICNSIKSKIANITDNVLVNEKTKEHVAANVLRDMTTGTEKKTPVVQLSTFGKPMQVAVNQPVPSTSQLSADDVVAMQVNAGLSERQLFKTLRDIRLKFGRKSVERDIKLTLKQRKGIFSDLFSQEIVNFKDSKGNTLSRPFVYCNNTKEFLQRISLLRGDHSLVNEDKIGFDDGKNVLKLTLSIYDPQNTIPLQSQSKRVTRAQGIGGGTKFQNNGVNKIFILAAAPQTPETYENCKMFLEKTLINQIDFHFASDLKMANICLGIMSHASLHPCPYCEGKKNEFLPEAPTRTLDTISDNFNKWKNERGKKGTLKS